MYIETVANPGRLDEYFTDSVIINSRNILNIEHFKDYEKQQKEFTEAEIRNQFTAGSMDLVEREKIMLRMENAIKERTA